MTLLNRLLATLLALCIASPVLAADISASSWSESDSGNTAASPNGWPPGTLPTQVEPIGRATMGALKRFYDHINATVTSAGSANVQTLTYSVAPTVYVAGDAYAFFVGSGLTNTGATTLNVNALGAVAIQKGGNALTGGELVAGTLATVIYDGTNFQLPGTTAAITGGTIDGTPIGATTPSTGAFTTLSSSGGVSGTTAAHVATEAALAGYASTAFPNGVWRDGPGAPVFYTSANSCPYSTGIDAVSCVSTTDSKVWVASFSADLDPQQWGAANNGVTADDTPLAAVFAFAEATGKTVACHGSYGVNGPLVLAGTSTNQLKITGSCEFNGVSSSATAAILELGGLVTINGQIKANCNFSANYSRGIWVGYNGVQTQFDFLNDTSTSGCLVGYDVGNALDPGAIVSEITLTGGYTYGSPTALKVEGANTYLAVVGSQLVSDLGVVNTAGGWFHSPSTSSVAIGAGSKSFTVATGLTIPAGITVEARVQTAGSAEFYMLGTVTSYNSSTGALVIDASTFLGSGTFTSWTITPPMAGLQTIGAFVNQSGGQLEMPGYNGRLINIQPLEFVLGNNEAQYGRVYLTNVASELPNVFADTLNPNSLTIGGAVTGVLSSVNSYGFVSQNLAPFITTDTNFVGSINIASAGWWASSSRSQPNIFSIGTTGTSVTVDANGFGVNFERNSAGGIVNAINLPLSSLGVGPTNTGTCTYGTQAGGETAGIFVLNADCASGTIVLNFPVSMSNGYVCQAQDNGTAAATFRQTLYAAKTCTLAVTGAVNGDFVSFLAQGF